jgi:hypothetical protein
MKRIANERAYVEHMLEKKEINEKRPGKDINSLIKYYYELDNTLSKEELLDKVSDTLLAIIEDEKAVKRWQVSIKGYINDFMSYADTFRGLSHVEFIEITENEINRIKELKNHKLEYTAFALLVYLKIRNSITGKTDNVYCPSGEEDVKNMKKISGLKVTLKEFTLLMKKLQDLGYTNNGIGGAVNCKLNYVDIDSKVIITVKDFSAESIPLYYTREIDGGRIIYCSECGKLVLVTNDNDYSKKYCKKCKHEKDKLADKKYNEKRK